MQWIELASGSLQETSGQLLCARHRISKADDSIKAIEIGSGIVQELHSVSMTESGITNLNTEWDALKALLTEGHALITQAMINERAELIKSGSAGPSATHSTDQTGYFPTIVRELAIDKYFPTELQMPSSAIPTRATMRLLRNGITSISQLLTYSADDLLGITHFGPTSLAVIEKRLAFYGLKLKNS